MARIIDRTFSCLSADGGAALLKRLFRLLIKARPDAIELSEEMAGTLSPLPEFSEYIIRIKSIQSVANFPGHKSFVMRGAPAELGHLAAPEIYIEGPLGAAGISRFKNSGRLRIVGLSDAFCLDYLERFRELRNAFCGEIELCALDSLGFASAIEAEWIKSGIGNTAVSSFCGIGGFAPTEELMMALKLLGLRAIEGDSACFSEMAGVLEKILGKKIRSNKPIVGERIFCVESGVHVDAILKNAKTYEPFPPESAGLKRQIVIGAQSGTAAIAAKLRELGIGYSDSQLKGLLERAKEKSLELAGALSEGEFEELARGALP